MACRKPSNRSGALKIISMFRIMRRRVISYSTGQEQTCVKRSVVQTITCSNCRFVWQQIKRRTFDAPLLLLLVSDALDEALLCLIASIDVLHHTRLTIGPIYTFVVIISTQQDEGVAFFFIQWLGPTEGNKPIVTNENTKKSCVIIRSAFLRLSEWVIC